MIRIDTVITEGDKECKRTIFNMVTPSDYTGKVVQELKDCGASQEDFKACSDVVNAAEDGRRYTYKSDDGSRIIDIEPKLSAHALLIAIYAVSMPLTDPLNIGDGQTVRITSVSMDGTVLLNAPE